MNKIFEFDLERCHEQIYKFELKKPGRVSFALHFLSTLSSIASVLKNIFRQMFLRRQSNSWEMLSAS